MVKNNKIEWPHCEGFNSMKESIERWRLVLEAKIHIPKSDSVSLRTLKSLQLEFLRREIMWHFSAFEDPRSETYEYGKLKVAYGFHLCFRKNDPCPVDNQPVLWMCDTFLEFSSGCMNFPVETLTQTDLVEREKLLKIKPLLGDMDRKKYESGIKIPLAFQCPERHKLWRMPDGSIIARNEPSIVDKTIDYAVDVIGMPNSLRWRGEGGWRRG